MEPANRGKAPGSAAVVRGTPHHPGPMRCAAHNHETLLRCGKCDAPICPDCTRMGPAGARCPACASIGKSPLFQVGADRLLLGALAGFAASFALGLILRIVPGFGFLLLWAALIGGGAVGEAVLRALGRKRGLKVEIAAGISAAAGLLAAFVAYGAARGIPDPVAALAALRYQPFLVLASGVIVFAAVSRVRFL